MIHISDYNPTMNEETEAASIANQAAVTAAINAALAANVSDIMFPGGTMWIKADNGIASGSGLRINVPDGRAIRFFMPLGSSIKRIAAPVLAGTSGLVFMKANEGVEIEWHGATFDGNEANCEYDAANPFSEEQSANIMWLAGTGIPEAIRFFRCDVGKNRVADGYKASVITNNFMASDCSTLDKSGRRTRADWQFSRFAVFSTMMTNCVCNAWESEPFATSATSRVMLTNVHARAVFDFGGDSNGTEIHPVRAQLTNVTCGGEEGLTGRKPFVNFYRIHGEFHNCHFRKVDRIQRCKVKFIGGSITVADDGTGAAEPITIWHDQKMEAETHAAYVDRFGNYTTFDGVTFKKDATASTGRYIKISTLATKAAQAGPEMVRLALLNCHIPEPIDRVVDASRSGDLEIRSGVMRANAAIVRFGNNGDYYNRVSLTPTTLWNAPALIDIPNQVNFSGSKLHISGEFDGDVMQPLSGPVVTSAPYVVWHTTATMLLDGSPEGSKKGFPGLRAKVRSYAAGEPFEYLFDGTDNFGQTAWTAL